MGLHKLTAGDGYTYLTRQVAAHDTTERGHASLGDYYSERGESPGRWWGSGLAGLNLATGDAVTEAQMRALFGEGRHPDAQNRRAVLVASGASTSTAEKATRLGAPFRIYQGSPELQREIARRLTEHNLVAGRHWKSPVAPEARAQIRTRVASELFVREHGRTPLDDRELSGFVARQSRQQTTAVAGFDLTFSPVKSVSALWAVAEPGVARQIEAAHDAAVEETLLWLQREASFTRRGANGVRQVPTRGLVAARFTHRDARSGDPDLHTHVAVSNKVQALDGTWLALDGRVLYQANVAASERYNTRLEAELGNRLGITFRPRGDAAPGKREVREVDGVDTRLLRAWARRRTAIDARRRELATGFQATHGRPPAPTEAIALAQQATLETRQAKHAPRSEAEQRRTWATEAAEVLGDNAAVERMVASCLGRATPSTRPTAAWVHQQAARVIEVVQADRATWQVWHVRAEAERQARASGVAAPSLDEAVDAVVHRAIAHHSVPLTDPDPVEEPPALRRPDGSSVYRPHASTRYTSAAVLDAENRLVAAADQTGGHRISHARVGIALAEHAANGSRLNPGQEALVRELATSGRRLQLALAPAGTGKTTALAVLAHAWRDAGGTVVGLAPSAVAAHQLRDAIDAPTDTLSKLVWSLDHPDPPAWVTAIDAGTLILVDEAGMAGTLELARAVEHLTAHGATVRLIGDDRQLGSVAAGGVLRDILTTAGAVTLSEVHRFHDPAEAAATLALRDGDPSALGFYADRGRIHVGDLASAADQAYLAWSRDRAAGRDSLLLAPTVQLVAELNARARYDRLAATHPDGPVDPQATAVPLADGTRASVGDLVVTRRNDRTMRLGTTDWVKNGDRWRITQVHGDGSVDARHLHLHRTLRLPAGYAREHVQLGYAATIHGAQGMTVDTTHTVLTGAEDRALAYVALTRGRSRNDLYLVTATDGDPHTAIHPDAVLPPTALEQLARLLDRDNAPTSAHTTQRDLDNPARQLADAAARYDDAVRFAADSVLGPAWATQVDDQAHDVHPGLPDESAWPTLRAQLALHALDGTDPATLLRHARDLAGMGDARDAAAVLDHRLPAIPGGPLPWLPHLPARLRDDPDWGPYLQARATRIRDLANTIARDADGWTPTSAPPWARHLTGPADARVRADLAVWRAACAVPESDPRPTGPHQTRAALAAHQRRLHRAARALLHHHHPDRAAWLTTIPDPVLADPWSPELLRRVDRIDRAGLDVPGLLTETLVGQPLPDECPASALWWRLVPHLGPAAVSATDHPDNHLHPAWLPDLRALLGEDTTAVVQDSPTWPALVAAVDASHHDTKTHDDPGWTPADLIRAAAGSLPVTLPVADLCEALVLRVAVLTDPPPNIEALPPDPLDQADGPSEPEPGPDPSATRTLHAAVEPPTPASVGEPPATGTLSTPRARIVELHRGAADFYAAQLPRSWAPTYLAQRLGARSARLLLTPRDTRPHRGFVVGYAPPGPTTLTRRLTAAGATTQELLDAGLARRRERGDIVDAFRDRLTFLIHDPDGQPVGFVGRRNPTKSDTDFAGPKYLNTRATAAFHKGHTLFGLPEAREALAAGALPVLVEGPLDALAVTLVADGTAVGLAPLGTALTHDQAGLLSASTRGRTRRVAVATDADSAGWAAAQVAYWRLTGVGVEPDHLALPTGTDPADVLESQGPVGIRSMLDDRKPLGDALLAQAVADLDSPGHPPAREQAIHRSAAIIASGPPLAWAATIDRLEGQVGLTRGVLQYAVMEQNEIRAADEAGYTEARIREARSSRPPGPRAALVLAVRSAAGAHRQGSRPTSPPRPTVDRGTGGLGR